MMHDETFTSFVKVEVHEIEVGFIFKLMPNVNVLVILALSKSFTVIFFFLLVRWSCSVVLFLMSIPVIKEFLNSETSIFTVLFLSSF